MKKIHLLTLLFVLIVLLGIILYRLWLISRTEGVDNTLSEKDIQLVPDVDPQYWYSFDKKSIEKNRVYNWGNQTWDAHIINNMSYITNTTSCGDREGIQLDMSKRQFIQIVENNLDLSGGLTFTSFFKQKSGGQLFLFGNLVHRRTSDIIGFSSRNGAFVGNELEKSILGIMDLDEWVHFAWTLKPNEGDTTKCDWTFYKNGDLISTYKDQPYPKAVNRNYNVIGRSDVSICDFRIYTKVLSSAKIKDLYKKPSLPIGVPVSQSEVEAAKAEAEAAKAEEEAAKSRTRLERAQAIAFDTKRKAEQAQSIFNKAIEKAKAAESRKLQAEAELRSANNDLRSAQRRWARKQVIDRAKNNVRQKNIAKSMAEAYLRTAVAEANRARKYLKSAESKKIQAEAELRTAEAEAKVYQW